MQRIGETLRTAGIEVWLDQSELRGGDAWDRMIRERIRDCRLFVPIISANTESRPEGYFRREWKLAVDRTHDMSERLAFIVPVVIDATPGDQADVPDAFRLVQWTRLPGGRAPAEFAARIRQLLAGKASPAPPLPPASSARSPRRRTPRLSHGLPAAAAILAVGAGYLAIERPWITKPLSVTRFAPPPHSIAVLPFVNMSGDRAQEYFSDGLTEELLNSLAAIEQLQVAARTSAFSFKGKHADIGTIARRLNVGAVLEGSVRRSGNTVRVTAQLIDAVSGFHVWSRTYDRDLGDVLRLETEIADAVATALKVTLLGDLAARIELGGTHDPAAFDAYLRASQLYLANQGEKNDAAIIKGYDAAIRLDPNYALAYAARSLAFSANEGLAGGDTVNKARSDALEAIALAPDLAEGHLALASACEESLDFARAAREYELAMAHAPGNARVVRDYGLFAVSMGRTEAGLAAARRAVILDPLNFNSHFWLGNSLTLARRYSAAIAAFNDARTLAPNDAWNNGWLGVAYYLNGNLRDALKACKGSEGVPDLICLAITYDKMGQRADAERALAQLRTAGVQVSAASYAWIYAQWGDTARALDSLETAMRNRSPWLQFVKTYPLLDPLRSQPRFQAVMRELKFPD
ncbi:MAG: TIR domain-containing protein [Gammaproteobacteria bacterium]|nr:TIR domain-containing protein [Gammaproteobacteria bacterium]